MAWLFVNRWTNSPSTPTSLWITLTVSLPLLMMTLLFLLLLLPPTSTTLTTAQVLTSDPGTFSNNNNNHRSKRSLSSGDCSLCFSTQDPIGCQRCLSQNLRRVLDSEENQEEEEDDQENVLAVSKKWTYEPMRRYQRGSGCSCCYFSRMTNVNCCSACSMTTKRAALAKRSGGMTSGDDAPMTSERVRGQGAILGRLNCQCCDVTGDDTCCLGCLVVL